ncbi:hypothetical protein PR048_001767 [Dryococelus australis]|uniref:Methyl-accepting transducer domain-containing protein n=1 Tax=Dryococelus australis TaxID=614101 RepID=A0ABQ9IKS2_9NEOP|nr:hypothetical protein PR048_001767 [Dryococelus australis]
MEQDKEIRENIDRKRGGGLGCGVCSALCALTANPLGTTPAHYLLQPVDAGQNKAAGWLHFVYFHTNCECNSGRVDSVTPARLTSEADRGRLDAHEREKYACARNEHTGLREDELQLSNYLRMGSKAFDKLATKLEASIKNNDTVMRLAIPPIEWLTVTLSVSIADTWAGRIFCSRGEIITCSRGIGCSLRQFLGFIVVHTGFCHTWLYYLQKKRQLASIDVSSDRTCPFGSEFFNYKKYNSVVLFVISDANYLFNYVEVESRDRDSDSTIFENSKLYNMLNNGQARLPKGQCLSGNFVMRPYTGTFLSYKKPIFNYRLCRARRSVACTFGILTNKWRIFHRPINVKQLPLIIVIIKCCCVLHNFVRSRDGVNFEDTLVIHCISDQDNETPSTQGVNSLNRRRNVFADYFVSSSGRLSWQDTVPRPSQPDRSSFVRDTRHVCTAPTLSHTHCCFPVVGVLAEKQQWLVSANVSLRPRRCVYTLIVLYVLLKRAKKRRCELAKKTRSCASDFTLALVARKRRYGRSGKEGGRASQRLQGKEIMQGDMHHGIEGLGSHGQRLSFMHLANHTRVVLVRKYRYIYYTDTLCCTGYVDNYIFEEMYLSHKRPACNRPGTEVLMRNELHLYRGNTYKVGMVKANTLTNLLGMSMLELKKQVMSATSAENDVAIAAEEVDGAGKTADITLEEEIFGEKALVGTMCTIHKLASMYKLDSALPAMHAAVSRPVRGPPGKELQPNVHAEQIAERAEQIAERAEQIAERIAERAERIAERAERIAQRAEQIAERAEQIAERAEQIAERAEQIAERAEQIAERIAERAERIAERAERIAERAERIAERAEQIAERAEQIAERAEQIAERAEQIAERIAERAERIAERAERIAEHAEQIAERIAERIAEQIAEWIGEHQAEKIAEHAEQITERAEKIAVYAERISERVEHFERLMRRLTPTSDISMPSCNWSAAVMLQLGNWLIGIQTMY